MEGVAEQSGEYQSVLPHRLAAKDRLKVTDLYGENLMLMRRDWSTHVD
ncbi:MAG: hypothetical protein K2O15_15070 [Lachnospiraceae bacterium]|nr:hypothetical protein [Lachnospiraceae bacterium]